MIQMYQKPLKGKQVGVVLGAFAPLHQGHLDLIMQAKKENDGGCLVIVCGGEGDKGEPVDLPFKRRYRYVREFFAKDDLVAVFGINDTEMGVPDYPNGWDRWLEVFNQIAEANVFTSNGEKPELIFYVGEPSYREALEERGYNAILVDRQINPISATMIRENPFKYWHKIALPFRRVFSYNILVTGTASEGKSTLVQDIGKYFSIPASHEWPRDYMADSNINDNELDGADYLAFLNGQYELNKSLINSPSNPGIFIADTDSMTTQMYAEYYAKDPTCALTEEEGKIIKRTAEEFTRKSRWDVIFVAVPHGRFVDDHTRYMLHSGMKERQELLNILITAIEESGNGDKIIFLNGTYHENFLTVKKHIEELGYE